MPRLELRYVISKVCDLGIAGGRCRKVGSAPSNVVARVIRDCGVGSAPSNVLARMGRCGGTSQGAVWGKGIVPAGFIEGIAAWEGCACAAGTEHGILCGPWT